MIGTLISLLTGCAKKTEPAPLKPGVSAPLTYPVLLAGERNLIVKDNQASLITTTVASGLNFLEMKVIDSAGMQYSVRKVTPFGRRSVVLDMGTSQFQVFLDMKAEGNISLAKAKSLVLGIALEPHGIVSGTDHGAEIATRTIQGAQSLAELIQACRTTWEWR